MTSDTTQKEKHSPLIFLFSGKRKSGKDYITNLLCKHLEDYKVVIVRISAPIKKSYATTHKLDYDELLSDSPYKEQHREPMIKWSEKVRNQDPGYFINKSIENERAYEFPIWIIPDVRRPSDIKYIEETLLLKTIKIRMEASEDVRKKRGFIFKENVDDAPSECGLDKYHQWDFTLQNNGEKEPIHKLFSQLEKMCMPLKKLKEVLVV